MPIEAEAIDVGEGSGSLKISYKEYISLNRIKKTEGWGGRERDIHAFLQ